MIPNPFALFEFQICSFDEHTMDSEKRGKHQKREVLQSMSN